MVTLRLSCVAVLCRNMLRVEINTKIAMTLDLQTHKHTYKHTLTHTLSLTQTHSQQTNLFALDFEIDATSLLCVVESTELRDTAFAALVHVHLAFLNGKKEKGKEKVETQVKISEERKCETQVSIYLSLSLYPCVCVSLILSLSISISLSLSLSISLFTHHTLPFKTPIITLFTKHTRAAQALVE